MRIAAIVLAAGWSSRMGRPKALLAADSDGETFLARLVRTLAAAGVEDIVVVGRSADAQLRAVIDELVSPVRYVANPSPERGQLSSLVAGVDDVEARGAEAAVVMPVDMPLVQRGTFVAAIDALRESAAPIVRVSFHGQHGHPVLFRKETFAALRTADPAVGAKAVVRAYAAHVLELAVDDSGVLKDIDLPQDYRDVFGRDPG